MKLMDLKNGAVVKLRNEERYLKVDNTLFDLEREGDFMALDDYNDDLKRKDGEADWDIVKVNNKVDNGFGYCNKALRGACLFNNWTWERTEILDEEEKAYLRFVIKPFRDRVEFIKKEVVGYRLYRIYFGLKGGNDWVLPYFKGDEKYKGMEVNREYTLEELGL